ncbi:metalloregulator ArsR/SmtB family transcription factor [soil metagenome]
MPKIQETAALYAALGDEVRLRILARLAKEGPTSIARLSDDFPITRQAVTKHLRLRATVGLVRSARAGRESRWTIYPPRLDVAREWISQTRGDTLAV